MATDIANDPPTNSVLVGPSTIGPPATIDGTGLSSVPLTILNGKPLSGVEVQVTGTAPSGFIVRDAAGLQRTALGYAVANADWSASSAAGDAVLVGPTTAGKKLLVQGGTGSTAGVMIASAAGSAYCQTSDATGAVLAFGGNTLTINGTNATFTAPLAISATTSLVAVALQVAGDANTGMGAPAGADTLALITGGVTRVTMAGVTAALALDDAVGAKLSYGAGASVACATNAINMTSNSTVTITANTKCSVVGRFELTKGADVASAGTLTVGGDGTVFGITGTATINYITTTNWQAGSIITLRFAAAAVVANNTGSVPGSTAAILTATGAPVTYAANAVLQLLYDGTYWIDLKKVA